MLPVLPQLLWFGIIFPLIVIGSVFVLLLLSFPKQLLFTVNKSLEFPLLHLQLILSKLPFKLELSELFEHDESLSWYVKTSVEFESSSLKNLKLILLINLTINAVTKAIIVYIIIANPYFFQIHYLYEICRIHIQTVAKGLIFAENRILILCRINIR